MAWSGLGPVGAVFATLLGKAGPRCRWWSGTPRARLTSRRCPAGSGKLQAEWPAAHRLRPPGRVLAAKPRSSWCAPRPASRAADAPDEAMGARRRHVRCGCTNRHRRGEPGQRGLRATTPCAPCSTSAATSSGHEVWVSSASSTCSRRTGSKGWIGRSPKTSAPPPRVRVRKDYREDVYRKAILNTALSNGVRLDAADDAPGDG